MKTIDVKLIEQTVAQLCIDANRILPCDMKARLDEAAENERSELGREVIGDIIENYKQAEMLNIPVCQDTGMTVVFAELGQEVAIAGGLLEQAINNGVAKGYTEGYLRCSVVADPLKNRVNTNNNTPAVIHISITEGDSLKLTVAPKGAGSENMSAIKMLTPAADKKDVADFVVDTIIKAGSNPCPPIVVGVGIGGNFEKAAYLAKKALCRSTDMRNPDKYYAEMENEILERINKSGIGPQGFGGTVTAMAVNIETYPTHIASLPVAVNVGCHATRHKTAVL
ncbi:MAG TPA: fumarate hydratase [Ruminococcaceae bacterium]|nr:fumarate hydratase [Oscillospiraceae bacterium]